ncbi:MAG: hypothetical protein KAQ65_04295 [Candidatus Thorarchaeota archaeon]|nr:hypothetical protein [Candidatus Thorarchaeota archaeon]
MKREYRIPTLSDSGLLDYQKAEFPEVKFVSITKTLTELSKHKKVICPQCGNSVDFNRHLEWYGPHHFTCQKCSKIVHFKTVAIRRD